MTGAATADDGFPAVPRGVARTSCMRATRTGPAASGAIRAMASISSSLGRGPISTSKRAAEPSPAYRAGFARAREHVEQRGSPLWPDAPRLLEQGTRGAIRIAEDRRRGGEGARAGGPRGRIEVRRVPHADERGKVDPLGPARRRAERRRFRFQDGREQLLGERGIRALGERVGDALNVHRPPGHGGDEAVSHCWLVRQAIHRQRDAIEGRQDLVSKRIERLEDGGRTPRAGLPQPHREGALRLAKRTFAGKAGRGEADVDLREERHVRANPRVGLGALGRREVPTQREHADQRRALHRRGAQRLVRLHRLEALQLEQGALVRGLDRRRVKLAFGAAGDGQGRQTDERDRRDPRGKSGLQPQQPGTRGRSARSGSKSSSLQCAAISRATRRSPRLVLRNVLFRVAAAPR